MYKANIISCDPPWEFNDKLTMSDVARGAAANYPELNIEEIKNLKIKEISADDAILALWVPGSLLQQGLDVMKEWGFEYKQNYIWVKTKKNIEGLDINDSLAFGMGRLFRQTHEIALIGIRGKIYNYLKNKSQRSLSFYQATKHSKKPELLQDSLDLMFPDTDEYKLNRLELFARRKRNNWKCLGNESPESFGEDIRDSINKLISV